jgi:hypothetical protein
MRGHDRRAFSRGAVRVIGHPGARLRIEELRELQPVLGNGDPQVR